MLGNILILIIALSNDLFSGSKHYCVIRLWNKGYPLNALRGLCDGCADLEVSNVFFPNTGVPLIFTA